MKNLKDVSYFAVIPAPVRYDQSLPPGAKLLYGDIIQSGYLSNNLYAELYGVSVRQIQSWKAALIKARHLTEKDNEKQ